MKSLLRASVVVLTLIAGYASFAATGFDAHVPTLPGSTLPPQ